MKNKIVIEKFGKIEHAELTKKPMMMFIGNNNSGKSYLMNLLWGLTTESRRTLVKITPEIKKEKIYQECRQYFYESLIPYEGKTGMTKDWFDKFLKLLNTCIEYHKNLFVSSVFNTDMTIGKMRLELEYQEIGFEFAVEELSMGMKKEHDSESYKMLWIYVGQTKRVGISWNNIPEDFVMSYLLEVFLGCWESGNGSGRTTAFLPSSRTGFILSKNLVTNNVYENTFNRVVEPEDMGNDEEQSSYFTKPVISFLKLLNEIDLKRPPRAGQQEIAEFMERMIIDGRIEIKDSFSNSFVYKPNGLDREVQMYLTSAVVTEIAPLYLLCKYNYPMRQLFIEEPEMCMHPEFQDIMAKILIWLCNEGTAVTMTTHSDIIIQHINNMIRLNKSEHKKDLMDKYGLKETDTLHLENVAIYQLNVLDTHKSEVIEVKADDMGFETTTFSDAYEKMLEQTYDIQEV